METYANISEKLSDILKMTAGLPQGRRNRVHNYVNKIRLAVKKAPKQDRVPDDNPNDESTGSQKRQILHSLEEGKRLTALTMLDEFGAYHGIRRISDLRSEGYPIQDEWTVTKSGKRVKVYFIDNHKNQKSN